tara:strand:+ start:44 stop:292 length:249 start_codon:yes stop_codon:yes gene_type:complete
MTYSIVATKEIDRVDENDNLIFDFSLIRQDNKNTCRYSVNGNQFIVSYIGEAPLFLEGYKTYNRSEIKEELNSSYWTEDTTI